MYRRFTNNSTNASKSITASQSIRDSRVTMTWLGGLLGNLKRMKTKPVYTTIEDEDGNIIEEIPMTEADDDWMRAGRLARKAREGDIEAAEKLRQMENTPLLELDDKDEPSQMQEDNNL